VAIRADLPKNDIREYYIALHYIYLRRFNAVYSISHQKL